MKHIRVRSIFTSFAAVGAAMLVASSASATPVQLVLNDTPIVQQTNSNPCVIGNPSCNNPAGFDYTLIPPNDAADTLDSPTYTVDQIRNLVGDTFLVGIDLQEPDGDYNLLSFQLLIDGNVEFDYPGALLALNNHGNGFSDWALSGFDLSPFAGSLSAVFHLVYADAQSEREQFFLTADPASAVPEPTTLALCGIGTLVAARRRRASAE